MIKTVFIARGIMKQKNYGKSKIKELADLAGMAYIDDIEAEENRMYNTDQVLNFEKIRRKINECVKAINILYKDK